MAVAKVIYIKWVYKGKVYTGGYCTAQGMSSHSLIWFEKVTNIFGAGIVQQLGDTGSALATLVGICVTFFCSGNLT